jgi:NAD+ synthase
MKYDKVAQHITDWLKEYVESNNLKGFVIGVSGGIDSAVSSTLCAKTGLPLLVVEMPIHQEAGQVTLANNHIDWLKENYPNVRSTRIDLSPTFDSLEDGLFGIGNSDFDGTDSQKEKLAMANTKSRLRMVTLYSLAMVNDSIVCGTGNKVEDYGIKFFTKFGDGGVDLNPIGELMKSEVYLLGAELGLIDGILNAVPTDGLWEGSPTDEDQIGATYDELEWAMNFIDDNRKNPYYLDTLSPREVEVLDIYSKRHNQGKHKMEMPPVCDIPNDYR